MKRLWKPLVHRAVTGQWKRFVLTCQDVPFPGVLQHPGLYLHVPFCREPCPYCPYNREKHDPAGFAAYEQAVCAEMDLYASAMPPQEYCDLYVGGGTPTVDPAGLCRILEHARRRFRITGGICVELHPAEMGPACLESLRAAGVTLVSIGVETTDDALLRLIGRRHDGPTAVDAVRRASAAGFQSVNVDLMFALPSQRLSQLEDDLRRVLDAGADQVSAYPIFGFPYTELGDRLGLRAIRRPAEGLIRRMFARIGEMSEQAGMKRCAVWSYIRPRHGRFSSVSRHHYVGFGPSAASMIGSHFHVNTFSVREYASVLPGRRPIALATALQRRQEMAYWLYWRIYEMRIPRQGFHDLFGQELEDVFGHILRVLRVLGMVEREDGVYRVKEEAAYHIHRVQNEYSLNYINRLWGRCRREAWPDRVVL